MFSIWITCVVMVACSPSSVTTAGRLSSCRIKPPEATQATYTAPLNYPERALPSGLSTQLMSLSFTTFPFNVHQLRSAQSRAGCCLRMYPRSAPLPFLQGNSLIPTKDSAKLPALFLRRNLLAPCGESTRLDSTTLFQKWGLLAQRNFTKASFFLITLSVISKMIKSGIT